MATVFSGLCSTALPQLSAERVLELAVAYGIDAIEWGADAHVPPGAIDHAERLGERCRSAGVATPTYASYLVAGGPGVDADVIGITLDTAEALRSPNVRVWLPAGEVQQLGLRRRAEIVGALAEIVDAAQRRGMTVSLEHDMNTLADTARSTLELLDAVQADTLFTSWSPDGAGLDGLRALAPRLSHLYLHTRHLGPRTHLAAAADELAAAVELARSAYGTWAGARVAFLAYVPGDDPELLGDDSATLARWCRG